MVRRINNKDVYKIAKISEDAKQIPHVNNCLISETNERPIINIFILLLNSNSR